MVYNVAINNTDDHLRQWEFVKSPCDGEDCYRLSPMYDAVPVQYPYPHVTSVNGKAKPKLTDDEMAQFAIRVGIDPDRAIEVKNQVVSVVRDWEPRFRASGVDPKDIQFMSEAFEHGLRAASPDAALGHQVAVHVEEPRQRALAVPRPYPSSYGVKS
jgi:serine/threonine protein kinase HipA of HipAB toxin-antitoxin module